MAENWDGIKADVRAALGDNGFEVVLQKRTSVKVNPDDAGSDTWADNDAFALDTGIRHIYRDGKLEGRRRVLLMGADVEPAMKDRVVILGDTHEIVQVSPIAPAGVAVLYKVECEA